MAIAHVNTDTHASPSTIVASLAITMPTGATSSQVAILTITSNATTTITPPSGWTRIGSQVVQTNGTGTVCVDVFWSLGNNTQLTFTNNPTNGTHAQAWVCATFSGVDTTNPVDVAGTGNTSINSSTVVASSLTTTIANDWELICVGDINIGTYTATGFTVSQISTFASAGLLYNVTPLSIGATGTVTVTDSAANANNGLAALPFTLAVPHAVGSSFFKALNALSGLSGHICP